MRLISSMNRVPAEFNLGGTSTTEKVFCTADTTPLAIVCPIPMAIVSNLTTTGRQSARIRVTAGGRVTGGTTTNWTAQLQFGISTTTTTNTDIESGVAVAVNSVSGLWEVQANLIIATSGRVDGFSGHFIIGSTRTVTAPLIIDNAITTFDPTLTTAIQGFVVTGTFSSGSATNAAYMDYFTMEGML